MIKMLNMMRLLLLTIIMLTAIAFKSYSQKENINCFDVGIYHGKTGFLVQKHLFVIIKKDVIIVDCFIKIKCIEKKFSDTIFIGKDFPTSIYGSNSAVFVEKGKLKAGILSKNYSEKTIVCKRKIKANSENKKLLDYYSNEAYLENIRQTNYELFLRLIKDFKIREKLFILNHNDFVSECERVNHN
jgi:hypothetical protein